ncbi:unnamed protein product [Withania somnifera]
MVSFETYIQPNNPVQRKKSGTMGYNVPEGVDIRGRYDLEFSRIVSKDAFLLWGCRREAKMRYNNGGLPGFDPATKHIREGEWVCSPVPQAVADLRVEISGPVERKMLINALNSGAKVFMKLNDQTAKLFVRPRGWHLPEAHIFIDGEPATACVGFGPFFYLPKMKHSREARIWNNVFEKAEKWAGIEKGSIRATMNEILYELRDHPVDLNCGRWDYMFSYLMTVQAHPDGVLPDRVQVGMNQHFMRSYSYLLIHTCHKRGVHAMGSMAAQIPIRDDPAANEAALELVRKNKLREVKAGHDGTWAAHPGLIPACMEVFTNNMANAPNQIHSMKREDASAKRVRSMEGLRLNTRVGIQYLAAWLTGTGSVPLYNLMEDAATADISRVQNWQWLKDGVELDGDGLGVKVTLDLFGRVVEEEMARIEKEVGREKFKKGMYKEASKLFTRQCI